jgi:hypothetical protein
VGVAIKCVEQEEDKYGCYGCVFNDKSKMFAYPCSSPDGLICDSKRKDKKSVIFKLVEYRKEITSIETMREASWREEHG